MESQVESNVPGPAWSALLHRWFVQYNPLYLVSAAFVLWGAIILSRAMVQNGGVIGQLSITAVLDVYAWALIGSAALLTRIGLRRPAVMLALLTMLYQCDPTLHTERSIYLGIAGVLGSAVWLASFVAKLRVLAWAMRLRPSRSAWTVLVMAGVGLAIGPWVLRAADPDAATKIVAAWVFSLFAIGLWTSRRIDSVVPLDAWSSLVARRSFRWVWCGGAAAVVAHVAFTSAHVRDFELGILLPVSLALATRLLPSERGVWAWIGGTFFLVLLGPPEHLDVTSAMFAAALVLRAVRRPTFTEATNGLPATDPYRTTLELPDAPICAWTFTPSSRPAIARLLTGAGTCLYLAAWTHGWSGGPWPEHVVWLDALLLAVTLLVTWRTRNRWPLLPTASTIGHLVISSELLPTPQSAVQWGISAVALGFLLLAVGVGASIHWTSRTRGRYFATNSSDEITARHAMR